MARPRAAGSVAGMDTLTLRGPVVRPGDATYDELRRVFNGMIDRRPAAIARCSSAGDVQSAIRYARASDLPFSVHGGGHGVTGAAVIDDGLMIDLRPLDAVELDPATRTVTVGGGALWRDV